MDSPLHNDADLEAIDLEIGRLALLCDVPLLQPGVIEAIFQGHHEVCRSEHGHAWDKLRGLLILHYHLVNHIAQTEGCVAAAEHVQHSAEWVRQRLRLMGRD